LPYQPLLLPLPLLLQLALSLQQLLGRLPHLPYLWLYLLDVEYLLAAFSFEQ
jgi:hypothetical protein